MGEARNNKPKFGQKYKILISDLCSCVPRHQFVGTLLPAIEFEQLNWSSESRNYFCLYIYIWRMNIAQAQYSITTRQGARGSFLDLYLEELLASGIPDHVTSARAGAVGGASPGWKTTFKKLGKLIKFVQFLSFSGPNSTWIVG